MIERLQDFFPAWRDNNRPLVMGILNVTPDSFFDGGSYTNEKSQLIRSEQMLSEGADILDIGAVSTRPGSKDVSETEESDRLIPAIAMIRKRFPRIIISVDTFRAEVAMKAIDAGADMINDISAGNMDSGMIRIIADQKVPYIMMHMQGAPSTMQHNPEYINVTNDILEFFTKKIEECANKDISKVIIDPGFGFGKSLSHNYQLLSNLEKFRQFHVPLLVGVSRKSMIYKVLNISTSDALNGTTVLNTIALLKGASILRVHDVKEATESVKLVSLLAK